MPAASIRPNRVRPCEPIPRHETALDGAGPEEDRTTWIRSFRFLALRGGKEDPSATKTPSPCTAILADSRGSDKAAISRGVHAVGFSPSLPLANAPGNGVLGTRASRPHFLPGASPRAAGRPCPGGTRRSQDAVPAQAAPRGEIRRNAPRTDPKPWNNAVRVGGKNISTPALHPLYQYVTNRTRGSSRFRSNGASIEGCRRSSASDRRGMSGKRDRGRRPGAVGRSAQGAARRWGRSRLEERPAPLGFPRSGADRRPAGGGAGAGAELRPRSSRRRSSAPTR